MKLIFISDLHLSPKSTAANLLFLQLLKQWQGTIDGLYILGDFFDYWVGDDDDNEFIRTIKHALASFSQITPTYFLGGNHDFAVGKQFASATGITLLKDMHTLSVGSETILLSHGDTFCSLDINYQKMKRILQHPLTLFILRRLPLAWRYRLKQALEGKSQAQQNQYPSATYLVVDDTIINYVQQYQASMVIHGHTHNPGEYLINVHGKTIRRIEIPDWQDHQPGGYVYLDNGIPRIISANPSSSA